jgi:hypothetical protein
MLLGRLYAFGAVAWRVWPEYPGNHRVRGQPTKVPAVCACLWVVTQDVDFAILELIYALDLLFAIVLKNNRITRLEAPKPAPA